MNDEEKDAELVKKTTYTPINIATLNGGTTILLDTEDFAYIITIIKNDGKITIEGGQFFQPTNAILIGSSWEDEKSQKLPKCIVKGMCIHIKYKNDQDKKYTKLKTTPVETAKIVPSDKSWDFEMWKD